MVFNFYFTSKKISHTTACLIQGLNELGHEIHANYIPEFSASNGICAAFSVYKPNYIKLLKEFESELVIVDCAFGFSEHQLNELNDLSKSKKIVVINMNDSVNFLPQPPHFYIFHGHYNTILPRKGRTFPMAFGLSKEIIDYANNSNNLPRHLSILHNFRPSENQHVRLSLMLSLLPNLRKYFKINSHISDPADYPTQLLTHQAVFCYGGSFYADYKFNDKIVAAATAEGWLIHYEFENTLKDCSDAVVFRFDSWRLYEAAIFGAAPITLNFEKYGLETGANPRPWIEYIPIEFDKVESLALEILNRLKEDPEFLIKVGQNARRWVIENHSPVATVKRFIQKLEEINILPSKI